MISDPPITNKNKKLNNLILHIHPKQLPEKALKFTLTWGLGGMGVLLFVLLTLTGILLRFVYVPTPEGAYESIVNLRTNLVLGNLVRNIHYWSATLLILITFLHLIRVFFTGAYGGRRSSNWIIGLCVFFLVLVMSFTGYLLPWDQLAYWAITVITNMFRYIPLIGDSIYHMIVQGEEIGASTLLVFYSLHTALIPLSLFILLLFHFWKIRKAGGVVIPVDDQNEKVKKVAVWPNLLARELVVALVLVAFIMLLSLVFDAPIQEKANPLVSPNPAKAAWYFMGFQELLLHFQPFIAILLIPISIVVLMFYLPYIKNINPRQGHWFLSSSGKKTSIQASLFGIGLTSIFILADEYIIRPSSAGNLVKNGVLSLTLLIGFLFLLLRTQKSKYNLNRAETVQSLISFILASFILLTLVGNLLRGTGMALTF